MFSIKDISTDWLQGVLESNFGKTQDQIQSFHVKENKSGNSSTAVIKLTYREPTQNDYPKSFFLKICKYDNRFVVDSEYLYYTRDYKDLKDSPLPKCFDADYFESENSYYVLLEDLSQTHYSNKDIAPTRAHSAATAKELARLHAYRWGSKDLRGSDVAIVKTEINKYCEHISRGLLPILDVIRTDIDASTISMLERIFRVFPERMIERSEQANGMTWIHGDPNPSNILSPVEPSYGLKIIDRQPFKWSLTYWLAVSDIAYMIVPFWPTTHRRTLEKGMIHDYQNYLRKFGVKNYPIEECLEDYRLCIVHGIFTAIEWGVEKDNLVKMKWLWRKQLERSLTAFRDWNCEELL